MRLLVTGGAGFLGSNFVHHWVKAHPGDEVVVYDALTYAGNRASLEDVENAIAFVQADICDLDAAEDTLGRYGIQVVVHFAAESHNSRAALDPALFVRTNVLGTQALLEAARRQRVERFHHISTCEVFGEMALDDTSAFDEDSPYRPRTPYSAYKAGADHVVRSYAETFGLPVTITNCCNNYGPYQFPEKLVALCATRALDERPLPLYASLSHRREWIHVIDHCRAVEAVLLGGREGQTYLVGTGVEATIEEIADLVLQAAGKPMSLKSIVPDRPGHDSRYLLDSGKLRRELGWAPQIDLSSGIAETVAWYRDNRSWWEPLLERDQIDEHGWADAGAARR